MGFSEILLITIGLYYIVFRILGKRQQKSMGYDNFEWWTFRAMSDMFKNQGYLNPEYEAKKRLDIIIKNYKQNYDDGK